MKNATCSIHWCSGTGDVSPALRIRCSSSSIPSPNVFSSWWCRAWMFPELVAMTSLELIIGGEYMASPIVVWGVLVFFNVLVLLFEVREGLLSL